MRTILQSLKTKLQSTALTSWYQSLGGRVYLDEAPPNITLPLCRYSVADHAITQTFENDREAATLVFQHYHTHRTGANVALAAADSLHDLLDNSSLTATGYDRVVIRAESRGVSTMQDDAIVTESRFRIIAIRGGTAFTA